MAAPQRLLFFYVRISANRFIIRSTVGLPISNNSPLQDNEGVQNVNLMITVVLDIDQREALKDQSALP